MKLLQHTILVFILFATLSITGGCRSKDQASDVDAGYRTIPAEIGRDTETAQRRTAEASLAINEGRLDDAEHLLHKALDADVMYGPAHNNLGQVYYTQQRFYEAAWEFQYAIRLMPHQPIPRNNLGLVFEATGQLDQAAKQYELAVAEEPDNPQLIGNLARAKVRSGETGPEVRQLLQQIMVKDHRPQWRRWADIQLNVLLPDNP